MFSFKKFSCLLAGFATAGAVYGARPDVMPVFEVTDRGFDSLGQPAAFATITHLASRSHQLQAILCKDANENSVCDFLISRLPSYYLTVSDATQQRDVLEAQPPSTIILQICF